MPMQFMEVNKNKLTFDIDVLSDKKYDTNL